MTDYVAYRGTQPDNILHRMLVVTDITKHSFAPGTTFRDLIDICSIPNSSYSEDPHPIVLMLSNEQDFIVLKHQANKHPIQDPLVASALGKRILVRPRLDKEGLSIVIYLDEGHSSDILLPIRDLPLEHFLDAPIEVANEMEISEEFLVDPDGDPYLAQEFNSIYLTTHIVMHEIFHEASLKYHLEDTPTSGSN